MKRNGPEGPIRSNSRPPKAVAVRMPIAPKSVLIPIIEPRCLTGASCPIKLLVAMTVPMALQDTRIKKGRLEKFNGESMNAIEP